MVNAIIDADTGNEIIMFYRHKKPYIYLRDPKTKQFIKRLNKIEIRFFMEVRYDKRQAKKSNPIYADFVALRIVLPEEISNLGEIEEDIDNALMFWIASKFGGVVEIAEDRGFEYGSHIRNNIGDNYIQFKGIRANTYEELTSGRVRSYEGFTEK